MKYCYNIARAQGLSISSGASMVKIAMYSTAVHLLHDMCDFSSAESSR